MITTKNNEHEKNQGRKVLNVPNLRFPGFQGEWEKNDWQTSQTCIKVLVYPKTNCLMMANLVFYMESFTRSTNRKQKEYVNITGYQLFVVNMVEK